MITVKINQSKLLWMIGFMVQGLLISTIVICTINYVSGYESENYYGEKIWCVHLWEGGKRCFDPNSPFLTGGIILPSVPLGGIILFQLWYLNDKYNWFRIELTKDNDKAQHNLRGVKG